ncbi:hypothetical protein [Rufibacter roseus]|uniref:STAS/SEC14 domain-containing protein n=1 Tax=Rufibacter roseus TaxID=1567108 RepID=A0ABW2DQX4_9BACT|nr:hypothetical protein [Rufibacter roseus]
MVTIADTPFYQITVDETKNRIYMKMFGVWEFLDQVPDYLTHVKEALTKVSPGFSIVTDIREMEDYSFEVQELHIAAQKLIVAAGLLHLAEVHNLNDPSSEVAIAVAQESKINLNIFQTLEEAEAWLDEL